ncbi:hypothetical protein Ahy_B03g061732 isoform B [Arachis hypogaea]|uniref:Uncharacterized protein n=1 Tax=Arachis hypogaea TaxID=3818 RepID=A0A444ZRP7_ARAHY|nr:hypothetical protein Ahy_B03g061732 isoform B [Arachis hypogaea]
MNLVAASSSRVICNIALALKSRLFSCPVGDGHNNTEVVATERFNCVSSQVHITKNLGPVVVEIKGMSGRYLSCHDLRRENESANV